jgi:hypothetical protein
MNRREFCQHLALLAAGAAALPAQVAAFERLYDVNTRKLAHGSIISIHNLVFGFNGSPCDETALVTFFDGDRPLMPFALNTRSSMHFGVTPDCPMLSTEEGFRWEIQSSYPNSRYVYNHFTGGVRYIDMEGVIHNVPINGTVRHL